MEDLKECRVHSVEQLAERHNHSLSTQRVHELSTREVEGKSKLASLLLTPSPHNRYEHSCTFTVRRVRLLLHQTALSQHSLRQYIHMYCTYHLHFQTVCYLLWGWSNIIRSPSVDGHANGLRCLATSQIQSIPFQGELKAGTATDLPSLLLRYTCNMCLLFSSACFREEYREKS